MRPMLAARAGEIQFPVFASPKLDGIRALVKDGVVLSRSLKPIRNRFVQQVIGAAAFHGLDGELIVGSATASDAIQTTTSGVMASDGEPDFTFWVFDSWAAGEKPFHERLDSLTRAIEDGPLAGNARIKLLPQTLICDEGELKAFEAQQLEKGFEGVIVRSLDGPYKHGRSTAREGYLLKLKRFSDAEAEVIGFEELLHNANKAIKNGAGLTERSTRAVGRVPGRTLGAFTVRDLKTGIKFRIGAGFTAEQRRDLWRSRKSLIGRTIKYKHFESGVKEAPRHPVWIGFRDPRDMS